MKYTESQLEQAFISLLETEGYRYIQGKDVVRDSIQEVLIKEDIVRAKDVSPQRSRQGWTPKVPKDLTTSNL